ncbi:MAG: hypothetical protein ACI4AQ_03380 [Lachnospiraceae bacterium]
MIGILLMILKILGILLLVIIGLILFIILLILLVPIGYRLEVDHNAEHSRIQVKGSWLLFIGFFAGLVEKKFSFGVRIFGIPVLGSGKKVKQKSKVKTKGKEMTSSGTDSGGDSNGKPVEENQPMEELSVKNTDEGQSLALEKQQEETKDISDTQKEERRPHRKWNLRLLHPVEIYEWIQWKVLGLIENLEKKIHQCERKFKKILAEITSEENREYVLFLLGQLKKVFKHVLPKKHKIYVHLGLADPSLTGEILGAYSIIRTAFGLNFILEPEFDKEVLEVKMYMAGRIQLLQLLIVGIRIFFNKTTRKFLRRK